MNQPATIRSRHVRLLAGLVAGALTLAACGSSGDDESSDASPTPPAATRDAFPVTVEHKYGETTVDAAPERIVTVGLTDQDALLALGIVPVATTEWFGEHPGSIFPWAQDELEALGAEPPESVGGSDAVNHEAIAAQRPDLILALYAGLTQEDYDKLSAIAPTVAQPGEHIDFGIPWEQLTRTVGQVVGQADKAEDLIDGVEAAFDEAVEAHPEFEGASGLVATPYEGIFLYGPTDPRGQLLTRLGFELPEDLAETTGDEFGGNLSEEHAEMLDVDAIVWLDAEDLEDPLGGPLYASFDVHTEGREVFLDSFGDPLGAATSFLSVLSLPFMLDGLVPQLAAAVDGDPATAIDEAGTG
jgi:iron complex transport system substrate-binding protein